MSDKDDKKLERLYDYTKFHIGIYLSFAGGIAGLLGSQEAGWFLSCLVKSNTFPLYLSLAFMVLAGVCGGIVASSTVECSTFEEFWNGPQGTQTLPFIKLLGKRIVMLEHLFFWISLIFLAYAIAIGFANYEHSNANKEKETEQNICRH